jgi:carboxymethylenebutenolidase
VAHLLHDQQKGRYWSGALPATDSEEETMAKHIDYYVSLNSPWTYLASRRFEALARKHNAHVSIWPVDFGSVFSVSGGLPLPKRAPQRQAYRMMELKRWRDHLGVKMNLEPKFFPANEVPAAKCVIALRELGRMADAIKLAHAVLAALWEEEKNTADPATLHEIVASCGLDAASVIKASEAPNMAEKRESYTQYAIEQGVFGAPSFVIDREIFWGQDRLDFVDRKLAA